MSRLANLKKIILGVWSKIGYSVASQEAIAEYRQNMTAQTGMEVEERVRSRPIQEMEGIANPCKGSAMGSKEEEAVVY